MGFERQRAARAGRQRWLRPPRARAGEAVDVDGDTPIAVAAGNRHTLVLYASGTTYYLRGAGERAQLGLGHKGAALNDQNKPQKVPIEAKVACIAAGHDYSLCADEGGALYSWGWSEYGKLGTGTDGSYNTRDSSIKITYTATDISKIPMEGKITLSRRASTTLLV